MDSLSSATKTLKLIGSRGCRNKAVRSMRLGKTNFSDSATFASAAMALC